MSQISTRGDKVRRSWVDSVYVPTIADRPLPSTARNCPGTVLKHPDFPNRTPNAGSNRLASLLQASTVRVPASDVTARQSLGSAAVINNKITLNEKVGKAERYALTAGTMANICSNTAKRQQEEMQRGVTWVHKPPFT